MKTKNYFNPTEFVQKVLKDSNLGHMSQETRTGLETMVTSRLRERLIATIIRSFSEADMKTLSEVTEANPAMDEIDILTSVADKIPGLPEKLLKAVDELYEEITYESKQIDNAMKARDNK